MDKESFFRGEEIPKSPLEEALTILRPSVVLLDKGEILDAPAYESAIQALEKLGELRNVTRSPKNLSEALEMVAAEGSTQNIVEALKILQEGFEKAEPLDAFSAWSKVEYTPTQWIMPDWLPAGRVTMLVGPPRGVGNLGNAHRRFPETTPGHHHGGPSRNGRQAPLREYAGERRPLGAANGRARLHGRADARRGRTAIPVCGSRETPRPSDRPPRRGFHVERK